MWDEELGIDVPEGGFRVPDGSPSPKHRRTPKDVALDVATAGVNALTRLINRLPDPK